MEIFDPQHIHHRKVSWPDKLEALSINIPSVLVQLLSHNSPASSEEADEINEFSSTLTREKAEIQGKLQELRRQVKLLKHEQRVLEKKAYVCKVISSPFRRLPPEILQQIASHYNRLPGFCSADESRMKPTTYFPLLLSQVCHFWRHTVHNTSSFWQNLRLPLLQREDDNYTELEYFGRLSGQLPLSVLLLEDSYSAHDSPEISRLFKWMITSWSGRDRLTTFGINSYRLMTFLSRLTQEWCRPPNVTLNIKSFLLCDVSNIEKHIFMVGHRFLTDLWPKMPDLRHLWLDLPDLELEMDNLHRESILTDSLWSKLSTLHLTVPLSPPEWATMMRACPGLEYGSFSIAAPEGFVHPHPIASPVSHSHRKLRDLILYFDRYSTHILAPFIGIQFPNVTNLQLQFKACRLRKFTAATGDIANHIQPFPSLKHLSILNTSGISKSIRPLLPLFSATQSVESLSIALTPRHVVEFVEFLGESNAAGLSLPKLQSLQLWLTTKLSYLDGLKSGSIVDVSTLWPDDLSRPLTYSLMQTWETRRPATQDFDMDDSDRPTHEVLKSMKVEFHTTPDSSGKKVHYDPQANDTEHEDDWWEERAKSWNELPDAMVKTYEYLRRKVERKGCGIEVLLFQDIDGSFGCEMEERLRARFDV
ncbi:hypothetical protein CVT24_010503 [Panaeolus cyanescens]|uniref:Uncharacterized protein n=1 Tax=Panaeolus cyanescens TaxID=181874 RepID=A0A409YLU7_9AGAR|nr:hypothetical protein CVT24_010503 [Panaeolus cyanescens]